MKKLIMAVTVLSAASVAAACEPPTEPEIVTPPVVATGNDAAAQPQPKGIASAAQAQIAFVLLRSSGEMVDRRVMAPFDGSTAIQGEAGWATVRGKKASSTTATESIARTDLAIDFASFALKGDAAVTGRVHWVETWRMVRGSCGASCPQERTEGLAGKGIKVRFVLNGETIADDITIDALSPADSPRWKVKVTTAAGQVFTFTVS
jgi:hypothetical protein